MQILSTTGGTLNFIPREDISAGKTYTLRIESESENIVIFADSNASILADKFYSTYTLTQALKESSYYNLKVTNVTDNKIIFRDKIFCTDQAANAYKISSGVFTQNSTGSNVFIYYEG